ncbi:MAG: RNA polymerase sigma factor [Phycisphaerae bacterium]
MMTTNTALLEGLRDAGNDALWTLFCERYRPVVVSVGRRLGLSADEAEDGAQEALLAFATAYRAGRYDRDKGRLRSWLMGIANKKIRDVQRRRPRETPVGQQNSGTGIITGQIDEHTLSEAWEAEWQRAIVKACLAQVRGKVEAKTMQAFELLVIKNWPVDQVVETLGMNRNSIYQAKSRVLAHMREIHHQLDQTW